MKINRVLIVDDEPLIRLTTKILLEQKGYTVFEAKDGFEGIEQASKILPELIILDIMMPEMDGWEVYAKLLESEKTANISVMIFTAGDFVTSEKKANSLGIKWIIRKPFDIANLMKIFDKIEQEK